MPARPNGVNRRLAAIHDGDDGKSLQTARSQLQFEFADRQNCSCKHEKAETEDRTGARDPPDLPRVRVRRGAHPVRGERHGQKVSSDHHDHHQHGRQHGMAGHHQAHGQQ